jgi:hypothetical protein
MVWQDWKVGFLYLVKEETKLNPSYLAVRGRSAVGGYGWLPIFANQRSISRVNNKVKKVILLGPG